MCTGTSTDAEELVTLLIAAGLFTVALDVSQMFSFPPTPVLEGLAARWVNFIGVELLSPSPYSNCIVHAHSFSVQLMMNVYTWIHLLYCNGCVM